MLSYFKCIFSSKQSLWETNEYFGSEKREEEQVIHSEPTLSWTSRFGAEPKEPIPPNPEEKETTLDSSPIETQECEKQVEMHTSGTPCPIPSG